MTLYFPNLNGLRFLAAMLVVVHHTEQIAALLRYPNVWGNPAVEVIGKLGVILFFVLSGFLITYLLLAEEQETGAISARSFYIRRLLRIWPLYFFLVVLCLWVLPRFEVLAIQGLSESHGVAFRMKALLFLLILPNVAGTLYPPVLYLSHSWSIGTEEQFYIVWPVLMRWFRRHRLQLFGAVFLGYLLVNYALLAWARSSGSPWAVLSYGFWGLFNINCMAIGATAAHLAFVDSRRILGLLRHRATELVASATAVALMANGVRFPHLHYELYALLFAVIILNAATNPRTLWRLENPVLDYLGKISYGLYMYHPLAIVIVIRLAQLCGFESRIVSLGGAVLLTTTMAAASYELFERRFLKLKSRFSAIVSGDDARRVQRADLPREPLCDGH